MATKLHSPLPPVLGPAPPRQEPKRPLQLTLLSTSAWILGALGLVVVVFDVMGLLATLVDTPIPPPANRPSPMVKLDRAQRDEAQMTREHFFVPNLGSALLLIAKSAALLIGGIAVLSRCEWGRMVLLWVFRLGVLYLLYAAAIYALQASYEVETAAKYRQLKRAAAAQAAALRAPSPASNTPFLSVAYVWVAVVVGFSLAQGAAFVYGARYLESDEVLAYFMDDGDADLITPEVVSAEAVYER